MKKNRLNLGIKMHNAIASSPKIVLPLRRWTKKKYNIRMPPRTTPMLTSLKIARIMKMITLSIDQLPSSLGWASQFRTQVCSRQDLDKNKNSLNLKLTKWILICLHQVIRISSMISTSELHLRLQLLMQWMNSVLHLHQMLINKQEIQSISKISSSKSKIMVLLELIRLMLNLNLIMDRPMLKSPFSITTKKHLKHHQFRVNNRLWMISILDSNLRMCKLCQQMISISERHNLIAQLKPTMISSLVRFETQLQKRPMISTLKPFLNLELRMSTNSIFMSSQKQLAFNKSLRRRVTLTTCQQKLLAPKITPIHHQGSSCQSRKRRKKKWYMLLLQK